MFWSRKKQSVVQQSSKVVDLATKLGVERRQNLRVRYTPNGPVCGLPEVGFNGQLLEVRDISVGGCCLVDRSKTLSLSIGSTIELDLHWASGVEKVPSKVVNASDIVLRIQFLSLHPRRKNMLNKYMATGLLGFGVTQHTSAIMHGPQLAAIELWSSHHGNSIALEDNSGKKGTIFLRETKYTVTPDTYPIKNDAQKCTRHEVEEIVLFLTNINSPSRTLIRLRDHLLLKVTNPEGR